MSVQPLKGTASADGSMDGLYPEWGMKLISAEQTLVDFGDGVKASLKGDLGSLTYDRKKAKTGEPVDLSLGKIAFVLSGEFDKETVQNDNAISRMIRSNSQLLAYLNAGLKLKLSGEVSVKMSPGDLIRFVKLKEINSQLTIHKGELQKLTVELDEIQKDIDKIKKDTQAAEKKYLEEKRKKAGKNGWNDKAKKQARKDFKKTDTFKNNRTKVNGKMNALQAKKSSIKNRRAFFEKAMKKSKAISSKMESSFGKWIGKLAAKRGMKIAGRALGVIGGLVEVYDTVELTLKYFKSAPYITTEDTGLKVDEVNPWQEVNPDSGGTVPAQVGTGADPEHIDPEGRTDIRLPENVDQDKLVTPENPYEGEVKKGMVFEEEGMKGSSEKPNDLTATGTGKGSGEGIDASGSGNGANPLAVENGTGTSSSKVTKDYSKAARYLLNSNPALQSLWNMISGSVGGTPSQAQLEVFFTTFQYITSKEVALMAQILRKEPLTSEVDVDHVLEVLLAAYRKIQGEQGHSAATGPKEQPDNQEENEKSGSEPEIPESKNRKGYVELPKTAVPSYVATGEQPGGKIMKLGEETTHFRLLEDIDGPIKKGNLLSNLSLKISFLSAQDGKDYYMIGEFQNLEIDEVNGEKVISLKVVQKQYLGRPDGRTFGFFPIDVIHIEK